MDSNALPGNSRSKFEWLVNIAIIVIAASLLITLVRMSLPWGRHPDQVEPMKAGARLVLPAVAWSATQQTLVLVLSTECHFCTESAPFYRRLVQDLASREGTRVIAVLPQSVDQGREYLRGLGVSIGEVQQVNLSSLGLQGTPTLMLVDGMGTVTDLWIGKLMRREERELFHRLQLVDAASPDDDVISASDLKGMIRDKNLVIVDVDNRDLFRVNHVFGAVNIPLDELEVRAVNELRPENKVVVYCHICEHDEESDMAHSILLKNGFNQVSVLKGGLKAWEAEKPRSVLAPQSSGAADKKVSATGK